jgi:hypothetical protein
MTPQEGWMAIPRAWREFIATLVGAAAWPLAARGQQPERLRHLGVLMGFAENDPEWLPNLLAFQAALRERGWEDSRRSRRAGLLAIVNA